jgi:uncharacterized membrane protein YfcA
MVLNSFLGALIGLIMGMTGAGGGILAVPALVVVLGFNMADAVPVSLLAVGISAMVGALDGLSKKLVRYRAAMLMALLGAIMSHAGIHLAHVLPEAVLMTLFAFTMLLVSWRTFRKMRADGAGAADGAAHQRKHCMVNPETGKLRWTGRCATTLAGIGAATGLFAGMLGVGGGFIMVPAFRRFTDITMHGTVATSLAVIALISLSTVASLLMRGADISATGWNFVIAAVAGMVAGRLAAAHVPAKWLQATFASLAVAVAFILLVKTYSPGLLA